METEKKNKLISKIMKSDEFNDEEKLELVKMLASEPQIQYVPTYVPVNTPYEPMKVWYGTNPNWDPYKVTCTSGDSPIESYYDGNRPSTCTEYCVNTKAKSCSHRHGGR